ncbi:hypothetical protein [Neptuniibacter caesariensis]|uniref:SnoaL-like domain-containing protein n=1 Tax=Neptuniibacter caesariensis TaxID=207954 RepID=A0A7U8C7G4_NEPCE|nr:hypothetical protein [Neptuniibacter caesariensis]EAR61296.1 hypothetical protein MED92_11234 [Oceanospirillum sp. MED92] [Neptuniibacter caesariensis]
MEAAKLKEAMKVVERYIYAKDFNRPHQMSAVFTASASLEMEVNSSSISFPALTNGLEPIADTLSRNFGATYDNVYTLCIEDSIEQCGLKLDCRWFVVMTHKQEKTVRLGFGRYQWSFDESAEPLAEKLKISIEDMLVIEPSLSETLLNWISAKSYPWINRSELLENTPDIDCIEGMKRWLIKPETDKLATLTVNGRFSPE